LRAEFHRNNVLRLPGFLGHDILDAFDARLPVATFTRRVENGTEIERTLDDPLLLGLMLIALNDPALFSSIDDVSGCGPIGCFSGRVHLREARPVGGHYFPWHTDAAQNRLVGITVNLSPRPYDGGVFQMRTADSMEIITEAASGERGDAVLFRISPDLEHHVTPVTGSAPRLVLAGWFRRRPDFWRSAGVRSVTLSGTA